MHIYRRLEDDPRVRVIGLRRRRAVCGLHEGGRDAWGDFGEPIYFLFHLAICGGRSLSARTALRPHFLAVQPGTISGGCSTGVFRGFPVRAAVLLRSSAVGWESIWNRGSPTGFRSC